MEYCKYGQIENIFYISSGGMESDHQGRQRKQIMKGIQIMLIYFPINIYLAMLDPAEKETDLVIYS